MKVIIFGATGMVGSGVLQVCLENARVASVLVVGRSPCGVVHPKLVEIIHQDFFDYSTIQDWWAGYDGCFFCLGVSSVGMDEAKYRRLTYDLTLAAARSMAAANRDLMFCYVSGQGTDSSERGRTMWARVKGATENALLGLPFKAAYMFRPGYIQPMKGVRSKTRLYRVFYVVLSPLYPVFRQLFPGAVTATDMLGRAMLAVVERGFPKRIIETRDINVLGA